MAVLVAEPPNQRAKGRVVKRTIGSRDHDLTEWRDLGETKLLIISRRGSLADVVTNCL